MRRTNPDDALRNWLRQGDPAGDGGEPDASEIASVRRHVLEAADEGRSQAWTPSPAWAAAAAVLLALLIGWNLGPKSNAPIVGPRPAASLEAQPAAGTPRQSQIQFDTPGGTRVVWVLDSDFEV